MEKKFSVDWFSNNIPNWDNIFQKFNLKDKDNLAFLEIGCFEGRATTYMLENILTGKNSKIHVVDTFIGSVSESGMNWDNNFDFFSLEETFKNNVSEFTDKVIIHKGDSSKILKTDFEDNFFDFIYIDGSHKAPDVLQDAVLSHPLLKIGGIIIFDDYGWKDPKNLDPTNSPELAVQTFYQNFKLKYDLIFTGYQIGMIKKIN